MSAVARSPIILDAGDRERVCEHLDALLATESRLEEAATQERDGRIVFAASEAKARGGERVKSFIPAFATPALFWCEEPCPCLALKSSMRLDIRDGTRA